MSRATAPGYSIDLSNAVRLAGRRARELGGVIPINFNSCNGNENENELSKWRRERSSQLIRAMQLRRERQGPYFHQFIVFELQDNGGLYRIDRRLRPNEDAPLNSLKDEGIPAFDTIEPVVAWDDPLFVASDCLISVEFKENGLGDSHSDGGVHFDAPWPVHSSLMAPATTIVSATGIDWEFITLWVQILVPLAPEMRLLVPETIRDLQIAAGEFLNEIKVDYLAKIHSHVEHAMMQIGLWNIRIQALGIYGKYPIFHQMVPTFKAEWKIFLGCWAYKEPLPDLRSPEFDAISFMSRYLYWKPPSTVTKSEELRLFLTHNPYLETYMGVSFQWQLHFLLEQAVQARLRSLAQNMVIKLNTQEMQYRYQETEAAGHDPRNIPRYTVPGRTALWQRMKTHIKQEHEPMVESTVVEMQIYLTRLIRSHCNRVEEYKWLTKADATQVAQDISQAMIEVWAALTE